MKGLIEKLKRNRMAFGLMSPEEQALYQKVGRDNCVVYLNGRWKDVGVRFDDDYTYVIKSDYKPEPEPEPKEEIAKLKVALGQIRILNANKDNDIQWLCHKALKGE